MKLKDRITMVGSGKLGSGLSHALDCNVYLLNAGSEYILIDAGCGLEPERIVANIREAGVAMEQVKHLLITHVHGDHAAGAYYFYARYGIQVICSQEAAPWLEAGDMEKSSLAPGIRAGVYPTDFQFAACPVSRQVIGGEVVQLGDLQFKVLDTPGHSRGHLSFLLESMDGHKALFAGDTVFAGGKIVIQYIWDCSIQDYAQTVAQLHRLQIDSLYPGHGSCLYSMGSEPIATAHAYFQRLAIPPNL